MSLFAASAGPPPFVSFKAGKLEARPIPGSTKFKMVPDKRKGTVVLLRTSDELVHFQWRNRDSGDAVENDLVVFPDDAVFEPIGAEADRCYILKFKTTPSRRFFFWMQEPDAGKDKDNVTKLNECLKDPPARPAPAAGTDQNAMLAQLMGGMGGGGSGQPSAAQAQALQQALSGADPAQLQAMLAGMGGMGGGGGMPAAPAAAGPSEEEMMLQAALAASLEDMGPADSPAPAPASDDAAAPGEEEAEAPSSAAPAAPPVAAPAPAPAPANAPAAAPPAAGGAGLTLDDFSRAMEALMGGGQAAGPRPVPLNVVVDADRVLPHLDEPARARLRPLMPEGQRDDLNLTEAVRSPQLQQALGSLTGALQTENVNAVFANFGLDPADGAEQLARGDGVGAFLAALQAQADRAGAAEGEGGADADGDATM